MSRLPKSVTVAFLALAALFVFVLPRVVRAQSTWTGSGGDTFWNDAANWNGGVPFSGSAPVFSDPGVVPGTNTVTLPSGDTSVSGLTFNTNLNNISLNDEGDGSSVVDFGSSAGTISVAGQHAINVPVQLNSDLSVVTTNATDSLTISGSLNGPANNVNQSGPGMLLFTGAG